MVFDLDLIKKVYAEMPGKIAAARKSVGKPLTLTEKIYMPIYMAPCLISLITEVKTM